MHIRRTALLCAALAAVLQAIPSTAADKAWSVYGNLPADAPVFSVAIDSAQPATAYTATTGAGLLRTDDGKTWRSVSADLPKRLWRVAVSPARDSAGFGAIYVASGGHGFYKSLDGGVSWKQLNNGLSSAKALNVRDIALGRNQIAIATSDGVYRSGDGGQNWQAFGLQGDDVSSLTYAALGSAGNPAVLLAGVDGVAHGDSRLLLTKDNGVTWTPIKQGIVTDMVVTAIAAGPVPSNADNLHPLRPVFVAGSAGVFKSDDGGQTFAQQGGGLPQQGFDALALSLIDPNVVYAATDGTLSAPGGVWRSTDRGASWTQISNGLTDHGVTALALSRTSPATLVAAVYNPSTPSVTIESFSDSQTAPAGTIEDPVCAEPACAAAGSPLAPPPLTGPAIGSAPVNGTTVCTQPTPSPSASLSPATSPEVSTPVATPPAPQASPCATPTPSGGGSSGGGLPIIPIAIVVGLVLLVLVVRSVTAQQ